MEFKTGVSWLHLETNELTSKCGAKIVGFLFPVRKASSENFDDTLITPSGREARSLAGDF